MLIRTRKVRHGDQDPTIIVTRADGDTLPLGGPRQVVAFLPEYSATLNHSAAAEHFAWESLDMTSPSAVNGRHLGYGSYVWDVVDLANDPDEAEEEWLSATSHPSYWSNAELWR
jgi:hypothetical protein